MSEGTRHNAFGQPVGDALPQWTPCPRPTRVPLQGRFCRLEPLDASRHADALHTAYAQALDARDWTYLPHERETDSAAFRAFIAERAVCDDPLHMAVIRDGRALGSAAYMRIDPANGVLELGHIHFAPSLQRTAAATEALVLMIRRAFDELGYRRLEWKCDALNEPSRRAACRLGFESEGIFRNAVVTKGRNRDTAWFAMTEDRWTLVRPAFDIWLAPTNFDAAGRQVADLRSIRDGGV